MAKPTPNLKLLADAIKDLEERLKKARSEGGDPIKQKDLERLVKELQFLAGAPGPNKTPDERVESLVRWWAKHGEEANQETIIERLEETANPGVELPPKVADLQRRVEKEYKNGKGIGTRKLIQAADDLCAEARRWAAKLKAGAKGSDQEMSRTLGLIADGANTLASEEPIRPLPKPIASKDIKEDEQPRPLIRLEPDGSMGELIRMNRVTVLSGEGSAGKSTFAGDLAALASSTRPELLGLPLYRHKEAEPGPVLWASFEENEAELKGRMERRWEAALEANEIPDGEGGDNPADLLIALNMKGHPLYGPSDRAGSSGLYNSVPRRLRGWWALREAVLDIEPALVIIDAAISAYTGDHIGAPAVRSFCDALDGLAEESSRAAIILLVHSTKGQAAAPKADQIFARTHASGSGQWTDAADCAITLAVPENYNILPLMMPDEDDRFLAVAKCRKGVNRKWTMLKAVSPHGSTGKHGFTRGQDPYKEKEPAIWWPKKKILDFFPPPKTSNAKPNTPKANNTKTNPGKDEKSSGALY